MINKPEHIPVLLDEVINALSINDHELYVDATFGLGGYTNAILNKKNCKVIAIDRDPETKIYAEEIKIKFDINGRVVIPDILMSFASLTNKAVFMGIGESFYIFGRPLKDNVFCYSP